MFHAVEVVCFDVGYTLLDETRSWRAWATHLEISPDQLFQTVREAIRRGVPRPHRQAFECLRPGADADSRPPATAFIAEDIYPDARSALPELRAAGFRLGAAGNMRADAEAVLLRSGLPLDFIGSSERWGAEKPDPAFFERVVEAANTVAERIVYVGDRLDNDVLAAHRSGMGAIFLRRGLWAEVQAEWPEADEANASIDSLNQLAALLREES